MFLNLYENLTTYVYIYMYFVFAAWFSFCIFNSAFCFSIVLLLQQKYLCKLKKKIHRTDAKVKSGAKRNEAQVRPICISYLNIFELIICIHFTENGTLIYVNKRNYK